MYYVYILWSAKSKIFYTGYTEDIKRRLTEHNNGISLATKAHMPWVLMFYCAFRKKSIAESFEKYLKTGSGKSLMYRRLVDTVALKKDREGDLGIPKL